MLEKKTALFFVTISSVWLPLLVSAAELPSRAVGVVHLGDEVFFSQDHGGCREGGAGGSLSTSHTGFNQKEQHAQIHSSRIFLKNTQHQIRTQKPLNPAHKSQRSVQAGGEKEREGGETDRGGQKKRGLLFSEVCLVSHCTSSPAPIHEHCCFLFQELMQLPHISFSPAVCAFLLSVYLSSSRLQVALHGGGVLPPFLSESRDVRHGSVWVCLPSPSPFCSPSSLSCSLPS